MAVGNGIFLSQLKPSSDASNLSSLQLYKTLKRSFYYQEKENLSKQTIPKLKRRTMAWSAENATKAYLRALMMVKRGKELGVAEFISALAAGNNAQLMVMICANIAGSTALALVAAAHQTSGRVVCILSGLDELHASKKALGPYANCVEFAVGDARTLLLDDYKGADFVLIDCHIKEHKGVFIAAKKNAKHDGALIVGYNALHKGSWWTELNTHFLPIGEGLLVTRTVATNVVGGSPKRSRWVVKVDKCTGEEHVFRMITSPQRKQIEA